MSRLFVSFEGIDRAGKTTQAGLLADALGDRAVRVREPGDTPVGERIRELLKDPSTEIGDRAEALLFAAARAEVVDRVIAPALAAGRVVVCDRFLDSSLAYQGAGRGLGVAAVDAVGRFATAGLEPDLTFLLALAPDAAAARSGVADRFEDQGVRLQRRVLEAYEHLAAAEPVRWRRVDAERPAEAVHAEVMAEVERAIAAATAKAPA